MSVLVATDLAPATFPAIHLGALIANARDTDLRLLHVVDFTGDDNAWRVLYETWEEIEAHATTEANAQLAEQYRDAVPEQHHKRFSTTVRFGRPADGILDEVAANQPELIVVGTVSEGLLKNILFGRTSNQLVREAHLPVLTVPPTTEVHAFRTILVAVDLSECGDRAIAAAKDYAELFGATVEVVHAVDLDVQVPPLSGLVSPVQTRYDEVLESRRASVLARLEQHGLQDAPLHIAAGRPDRVVHDVAEQVHADLIVMGTHGRRGFSRFFLGSTAERVLRTSSLPTLVVSAPS